MTKQITYESLLKDDKFLNDAANALEGMGETITNNRKEVLDKFLQKRRYFDTNISSTFTQGTKIKRLSDINQQSYANAINKVDQMPSAFSKGGAPMWSAIGDYAAAGVTDPTNLLSILAGAFTLGTGGAAVLGAKEAAKQGVKATVKAKIKALGTKPVLGSLAVEGVIAGGGGAAQQLRSQNVDMAIGRRAQGDYDFSSAGLQALAEGTLSPLAGAGINIVGSTIGQSVKSVAKATGVSDSSAVEGAKNWLTNWFLPQAGLDNTTMRNIEKGEGAFKQIKKDTENVSNDIDIYFRKDFNPNSSDDIDLINTAMEGDNTALFKIKTRSEGLGKALDNFNEIRKRTYETLQDPKLDISQKVQDIYALNPNYVRDIFQKYTMRGRQDFNTWKKDIKNKDTIIKFRNDAITNIERGKELGLRDVQGKLVSKVKKEFMMKIN